MKKLLILLTLTIIGSIAASASYRVYDVNSKGFIDNCTEMPGYEIAIEETDSSTIVSYTFSQYAVLPDNIFKGSYFVRLAGFGLIDVKEFPRLPIRNENILVPNCDGYELRILEHAKVRESLSISPARPPMPQSSTESYSKSNIPNITTDTSTLPQISVWQNTPQLYRGQKFANITVYPVKYIDGNTVEFTEKLVVEITYNGSTNEDLSEYIQPTDNFIRRNIAAPQKRLDRLCPLRTSVEAPQSMLILSSYEFDTAVEEFAAWKRKMGIAVEVQYEEFWSCSDVHAAIKDWYDSTSDAYFVILFGDHNNIEPNYPIFEDVPFASDYSYTLMDDEVDCIPDVYIGRIPSATWNEAKFAVDKIISYEKSPFGKSSKSKLFCAAYFQDGDKNTPPDGYEDRDFVRTSLEILNRVGKHFNSASEIFCCKSNVTPKYWSANYFDGSEIPKWLQKPNYKWNGSAQDIINAFNNGASLILHRDHGGIDGWGDPAFTTYHFKELNNGNLDKEDLSNNEYPILLSMNCLTGNYTASGNFTKGLLCSSNGPASVISSTRVSYSGFNDAMTVGLMASVFPNDSLVYNCNYSTGAAPDISNPVNSLGEMLAAGKLYMLQTCYQSTVYDDFHKAECEMFHCFGDPSLHFSYKDNTALKKETSISYDGESALVNISGENAYISFYDQSNGQQTRFYGKKASFPVHNPESLYISVTRPGEAPITGTFADLADVTLEDINKPLIIESAFIYNSAMLYINITRNPQLNRFLIMPAQLRITPITGSLSFGGKTYDITTEGGNFRYPISDFMLRPNYQFFQIDVILNGKVVDSVKIR